MYSISEPLLKKRNRLTAEGKKILVEQLKTYTPQSDVVLYTLALLPGDKLTASDTKFHGAFYKLKQMYPEFFSEYLFDTNSTCPYSQKLEQDMFFIMQSGCIDVIGPFFANYYMNQKTKEVILKYLDGRFSPEKKTKLKEIGKKLQDLLAS